MPGEAARVSVAAGSPVGGRAGSAAAARALPWPALVASAFWLAQMTVVVPGSGLGWDETVYASQVSGTVPAAFFSAPRARGITLLAAPVAEFTTSAAALRMWMALLSSVGLFLALRVWRGLLPGPALALAGAFFAGLWVTLSYGPQVMPNLWSAYGALAAVGCFLRVRRDAGDGRAVAGLLLAVAVTGLMRPPDAGWLALPLAVAVLFVPGGRTRALLWGVLAAGLLLGCGEWVVEAYVRYGGLEARLRRASAIQGGTGPHLAVDDQIRALDGRRLCRPCDVPWRHRATAVWWFVLPAPVIGGAVVSWRAGRRATGLLPPAVAACVATPYLFLIGYAAPRFLLPAYALLAVPVGCCLWALLAASFGASRSAPRAWWRPLLGAGVVVALCAHAAIQFSVTSADARSDRATRRAYDAVAARLHAAGVRPPCVLTGDHAVPMAYYAGCASRQVGGPDASITPAALLTASRTRPVAVLVPGGAPPPPYAASWRVVTLPHSTDFPAYRAYLAPPPGRDTAR